METWGLKGRVGSAEKRETEEETLAREGEKIRKEQKDVEWRNLGVHPTSAFVTLSWRPVSITIMR